LAESLKEQRRSCFSFSDSAMRVHFSQTQSAKASPLKYQKTAHGAKEYQHTYTISSAQVKATKFLMCIALITKLMLSVDACAILLSRDLAAD